MTCLHSLFVAAEMSADGERVQSQDGWLHPDGRGKTCDAYVCTSMPVCVCMCVLTGAFLYPLDSSKLENAVPFYW